MNYPLAAVVSDDNLNIYQAATKVYPKTVSQICHNHYKELIRVNLQVRLDPTYVAFMHKIEDLLNKRRSIEEFNNLAAKLMYHYREDPRCASVLVDIQRRLPQLTAYMHGKRIPRTTNLIESYNSHLEGRLKTIKGFESFKHADTWLNGYFIKRRLQKFTDCTKLFAHLNGTCALQHTMTNPKKITTLLRLVT